MNELDHMPPEELRKIIQFQSENARTYRRLFLDGRSPSIQEVAEEAPELCMVDLRNMDVTQLMTSYYARQANFDSTPFDPAGDKFRMFPSGVTIWSGFPGAGKTTLLRQLVCHLLKRGKGVFVASLEESPQDMLARLVMTAYGSEHVEDHHAEWFVHEFGDRLRMWGMVGSAPTKTVLATMRYAIRHEGVTHSLIDSLTCLDLESKDYEGQRLFAIELCGIARATGTHIHLVAHPRKPTKDSAYDISEIAGSSDLGRLTDNVIFIRRNIDAETGDGPTPMQVLIRKQRHGTGMCGTIDGWFHRDQRQFDLNQFRTQAIRYLSDDAHRE